MSRLVERLLRDAIQLGRMCEAVQFMVHGVVQVKDPSAMITDLKEAADEIARLTARVAELEGDRTFPLGTRVTKIRGSSWTGHVVGYYSTSLNPDGVCVESENEPGSVQVYPATALEPKP